MRQLGLKKYAPLTAWLYCILFVLKTNLGYRDMVPDWMNHENKQKQEESIIVTLVVTIALNYNSYFSTLLFLPPCILTGYYYQMKVQAEI